MKCPKCLYIGFETGDRCKNCGYDFSLLAMADDDPPRPELTLRDTAEDDAPSVALDLASPVDDAWTGPAVDRFRDLPDREPQALAMSLAEPELAIEPTPAQVFEAAAAAPAAPALPLFAPDEADDEPLVKLPAVPRMPLSVRKTPDLSRPRHTPAFEAPKLHEDAVLQFVEEPEVGEAPRIIYDTRRLHREPDVEPESAYGPASDASPFGRRVTAAIIDHGILLSIDLVVLYFTLRLTDLSLADWRLLPMLPMAAFLLSLKVAYLSAFTTAGGQTIGKMATHIRVVSDDGGGLDPARALRRAVLGLASIATAGAPFLTALTDPARRGAHDRASGTRVVALSPR